MKNIPPAMQEAHERTLEVLREKKTDRGIISDPDPVLSFAFIEQDLGVSHSTFFRKIRHELPIVEISDRRRGVRLSDYVRYKASKVRPASGRAA